MSILGEEEFHMREEYLEDFGTLRRRQQVSTDSMALTQSPKGGAGKGATSPLETTVSPTATSPTSAKTTTSASELPSLIKSPVVSINIEPHDRRHHHHHHSVRHRHIHSGEITETLDSNTLSQDIPIAAIVGETPTQKTESISGTSPPEGRGRSRLVRRKVRSSSEESTCSSTAGEKDLALINKVTDLIGVYSQTGDYKELARISRDDGIPAPLRRVCLNLSNDP